MPPTFLFAGGGSGGHISPALAICERLLDLDPSARTLFMCSTRAIDRSMLAQAKVQFQPMPGAPFSVRPQAMVRFARSFAACRRAAGKEIRRQRVDRIVAMGGFVAAPVVSAAIATRAPVTLVNLDDPPGKANRWIARRCDQVLSAIEVTDRPGFAERIVGMPIRRNALAPGTPPQCRKALGLDPAVPTLLVTGASQGARSINAMVTAVAAADPELFGQWQVLHLAGSGEEGRVQAAWEAAGVAVIVRPFLHGMGPAWGAADLAVSRAGASSVAEAWANAVPTLFLPYPYHTDRHQQRNAAPMAAAGGAVIETDAIDAAANVTAAGATLRDLMRDEPRRRSMRAALRACPAPDAAETIARLLLASAA